MMMVLFVFIFGTLIGSFLNVCIYRLPDEESIVFPGSHCRKCKKQIAWYDNIPVLSYLVLGGKCRKCKVKLSIQYPMIEVLTGLLFVLFYLSFGPTVKGVVYLSFSLALLVATAVDLRHRIIPDEISVGGLVVALILSAVFPALHHETTIQWSLFHAFIGVLAGGGFLYASAMIAEICLKKEAMGGGDIKLLAFIGALLGWPGAVWTIFVSSILGSLFGIYFRLRNKEEYFAFGPYISLAAFLYLFWGQGAISWYVDSFLVN